MGTLYVVAMPMGHSEDVTLRAVRVLREVHLIVAQDIPRAQESLACYGIDTPLVAYVESETENQGGEGFAGTRSVLEMLVRNDVALLFEVETGEGLSFAHHLVRAAVERGLAVMSVPGPSTGATALVTSGLPSDAYVSLGFLPRHAAERRQLLVSLAVEQRTLVALEVSNRLLNILREVAETLGDRPLVLMPLRREPGEKIWRGTVHKAMACFEADRQCGEWVLVIGGAPEETARWPEARVRLELARLLANGMSRKEAARQVAEAAGWRSREVYRLTTQGRFRV